jgi:spore coat polysaccharide biosynthesis protein SpsF
MNVVAIIQARMRSTRLPGKSLAPIAGRPLLGHVLDRVRACECISRVMLATSEAPADQAILDFAQGEEVAAFAGSELDVLDRFFQAATQCSADIVVRITADDPFKDPVVIDAVVRRLLDSPGTDYASNTLQPTFPEGLDVEAFTFAALEKAWREARLPSEREHVTPYMWKNPERFQLTNVAHSEDLSALRWTVDFPEDLEFARQVYMRLFKGHVFGMREVLALLESEPGVRQVNEGHARNVGYLTSLANDLGKEVD